MSLVTTEEIKTKDEPKEDRLPKEIEGATEELTFGSLLYKRWRTWEDIRRPQEEQWLENLRQFYSQYEAGIEAKFKTGRSKTFIGITRMKVMAAFARLVDIYFPATGKKHWEIKPTPEPTTAKTREEEPEITAGIPGAPQVEQETTPLEDAIIGMSKRIEDQLEEADYDLLFLNSILESCILGSGCIKAGSLKIEKDFEWILTNDGWDFQEKESEAITPQIEGPSVFDVYPDPDAATIGSAIGVYERHVLNKQEFRNLKKFAGFKAEEIEQFIQEHPKGNHENLRHEVERKKLANQVELDESLRYDVLEFWGYADGLELREAGVNIPDDELDQEFMANVWITGSTIIKATLDPSVQSKLPHFIFPYERVPNRLWGKGIPEICENTQEVLNAAARRLLDDVALSGPQFEVNTDDATPETIRDINDIFPFKVWGRTGGDTQNPLLRVFNVQSVSSELVEIISIFRRFMDEELNLPTLTSGENQPASGGHDTAQGMQMLMGASNIVQRTNVKMIDKYMVSPLISKLYMFNMQWSDDDEIKGDMSIVARGSATLIAKEVQTTQLINALNITNNPTDLQITKRPEMLRTVFDNQGFNPDDIVKTKEELEALSNDPIKKKLDELAVQKAELENQEVMSRIDVAQAEREKIGAAIKNDEELLRLKRIELRGKEIEAAEHLKLEKLKIDADIKKAKTEKIAGTKKTTVGNTRKTSKNDSLKTNNKGK